MKKNTISNVAKNNRMNYAGGTYRVNDAGKYDAQISIGGKQHRSRCANESAAQRWLERQRDGDTPLTPTQLAMAKQAFALVDQHGHGKTLLECLSGGLESEKIKSTTLQAAMDEYLLDVTGRLSKQTTDNYQRHLKRITAKVGGDTLLSDVTRPALLDYLATLKKQPQTYNHFLRACSAFWSWGVKREYTTKDPTKGIEMMRLAAPERKFLSVDKARDLLKGTCRLHPELTPYVALGLFAGIRPFETMRIKEDNIKMDTGYIQLTGDITKSHKGVGRMIKMRSNLIEWLTLYPVKGTVTDLHPRTVAKYLSQLAKESKVKLSKDVLRHSYATYAFAQEENGPKLAKEMGHSENVANVHYRGLATQAVGAEYFKITPDTVIKEKTEGDESMKEMLDEAKARNVKQDILGIIRRANLEARLHNETGKTAIRARIDKLLAETSVDQTSLAALSLEELSEFVKILEDWEE